MNRPNLLAIDCETGGLTPGRHALLSLAAVPAWDQEPFSVTIWPEAMSGLDPDATRINGYSADKWREKGAVGLTEALFRFDRWIAKAPVRSHEISPLAHNAGFDRGFIDQAYATFDRQSPLPHRWRCSMAALSYCQDAGVVEPGPCSLDALCGLIGHPRPAEHETLADATACLAGYCWLMSLPKAQADRATDVALTPSCN